MTSRVWEKPPLRGERKGKLVLTFHCASTPIDQLSELIVTLSLTLRRKALDNGGDVSMIPNALADEPAKETETQKVTVSAVSLMS